MSDSQKDLYTDAERAAWIAYIDATGGAPLYPTMADWIAKGAPAPGKEPTGGTAPTGGDRTAEYNQYVADSLAGGIPRDSILSYDEWSDGPADTRLSKGAVTTYEQRADGWHKIVTEKFTTGPDSVDDLVIAEKDVPPQFLPEKKVLPANWDLLVKQIRTKWGDDQADAFDNTSFTMVGKTISDAIVWADQFEKTLTRNGIKPIVTTPQYDQNNLNSIRAALATGNYNQNALSAFNASITRYGTGVTDDQINAAYAAIYNDKTGVYLKTVTPQVGKVYGSSQEVAAAIAADPNLKGWVPFQQSDGSWIAKAGPTVTATPIYNTKIVSDPDGHDYKEYYDAETGKLVKRDDLGKTDIPVKKAVTWRVEQQGGYDVSVGYDDTGKAVSWDPIGKTAAPATGTTYPTLAAAQAAIAANPAYAGATIDVNSQGQYVIVPPKAETPIDPSLGRPFNTYADAKAAADATSGLYVPKQLTNGLWINELKEQPAPTRTYPQPTGFGGGTTQPSISDINAWILGNKPYDPRYDINKDKVVNMQDVTTLEMQPVSGSTYPDAEGNIWGWDTSTGKSVVIGYDPTQDTSRQMTDYQKRQLALQEQSMNQSSAAQAASSAQSAANLAWQQQQAEQELALQKQQHLADLAAHPVNWLQYSSESGIPAAIQPWMLPLQPGQYGLEKLKQPTSTFTTPDYSGIPSNYASWENAQGQRVTRRPVPTPGVNEAWQVGQAIPGYTAENMKGMPSLLSPATQLYARMAPSMQQQYAGYQQAQTGALPEDTAWLLENQAPPSGRFGSLLRYRG